MYPARGYWSAEIFTTSETKSCSRYWGGDQTSSIRPCVFHINARAGQRYAAPAAPFCPMLREGCDRAAISSTVQWWVRCQSRPPLTAAEPLSNKQLVYLGSGFQLDQMTEAIQYRDHHVGGQTGGMAGGNDGVFCAPDDFDWHVETSQLRA